MKLYNAGGGFGVTRKKRMAAVRRGHAAGLALLKAKLEKKGRRK